MWTTKRDAERNRKRDFRYQKHSLVPSRHIHSATCSSSPLSSFPYSLGCWINSIVARLSWRLIVEYHVTRPITAGRPSEPAADPMVPWRLPWQPQEAGRDGGAGGKLVVLCHPKSEPWKAGSHMFMHFFGVPISVEILRLSCFLSNLIIQFYSSYSDKAWNNQSHSVFTACFESVEQPEKWSSNSKVKA